MLLRYCQNGFEIVPVAKIVPGISFVFKFHIVVIIIIICLLFRRGYCQLKEEALDRTMWRNRFGRGFGPVV